MSGARVCFSWTMSERALCERILFGGRHLPRHASGEFYFRRDHFPGSWPSIAGGGWPSIAAAVPPRKCDETTIVPNRRIQERDSTKIFPTRFAKVSQNSSKTTMQVPVQVILASASTSSTEQYISPEGPVLPPLHAKNLQCRR